MTLVLSPRNIAILAAAAVFWSGVVVVMSIGSGVKSIATFHTAPLARRLPLGLQPSDDAVERQWTAKLLNDLQSTAADESVAATIDELKSSIEARDQVRAMRAIDTTGEARTNREREVGGASGGASGGAAKGGTSALSLEVPQYDAKNIEDLQKAALSAAIPVVAKAPMPQLLRDMSDALARQKEERDKLIKRLAQLEPSVGNYNPMDVDSLTKAAEQE